MLKNEWPASDYAIGSYIQATIADEYLDHLIISSDARVLDIGCGDGSYSMKVVKKIPNGTLLGIDRSENMLALAREKTALYPNFLAQPGDVLTIKFNEEFDCIVSFWCLQWCHDLSTAYQNMFRALKKGGQLMHIIPLGVSPLMNSLLSVQSTGQFPHLNDFKSPIDFSHIGELPNIIAKIPFKRAEAVVHTHSIVLPSLDVFRRFLNGIAFFHGQIPDDEIGAINEAMVKVFDLECQHKHKGEYRFDMSLYCVTAEK